VRVHEVRDDAVIIDFNHPLAGQTLEFAVKVVGVQ
jgi:FKBP-type peptidyl-prolyl cis-trans isomerase 2